MQVVGAKADHAQADALARGHLCPFPQSFPLPLDFFYVLNWELNVNIIQPIVTTGFSGVQNLDLCEGCFCFQQITAPGHHLSKGRCSAACSELSAKPVPSLCLQELNVATKSLMWFAETS